MLHPKVPLVSLAFTHCYDRGFESASRYQERLAWHASLKLDKPLRSPHPAGERLDFELGELRDASQKGRLRIKERYEGVVDDVRDGEASIVYEVGDEGDIVEHAYGRGQFLKQELPETGERVVLFVHVVTIPWPEDSEAEDAALQELADAASKTKRGKVSELREFRKHPS